jgi:hypothetical protein
MSGPYRIPWIWGNSYGRDHVNYKIANNYAYFTIPGVDERADPDFDTLEKIMTGLWRVKTFEIEWSYSASGTIDLFSHPIDEHTPWSFSFSGTGTVTRRYVQDPAPLIATSYATVDEERHLFGRFEGGGSFSPIQYPPPLGSQGFAGVSLPSTALAGDGGGFGIRNPWLPDTARLNWRTSGAGSPVLEVIARSVAFSGIPAALEIPFQFQDVRDYHDPMDDAVIVTSGIRTQGQANPAVEIGDATFDMIDVSISRKCYRYLSAVTNRGFTVDDADGDLSVTATEYFPFCDSNGDPIYDTASGALLRDPFG